jgi:methylated-DNA-protein-cysteine methyltransferase-like protein
MARREEHSYDRIWEAVSRVPHGRVCTYGSIARLSGLAGQPRLVGYALHRLPPGLEIPWHRVINAHGEISLKGEGGRKQRRLLEREGVAVVGQKIDLAVFGWPASGGRRRRG